MGQILAFHMLDTGYCLASEAHILKGGKPKQVQVHSLVGLMHHSEQGWLLFDAGYAPRMVTATQQWPYWLYRWVTPFSAPEHLAVRRQIERYGLEPEDINLIIVSHFHADHVAGLKDFPNARYICSQAAYQEIDGQKGIDAVRRAYIPSLMPGQFRERATLIERFEGPPMAILGSTNDLFGDGSIRLMRLPGHARGQIGAFVQAGSVPVLLAADGAWSRQAIRECRPPARVTSLFTDDFQAVRTTLQRLNQFWVACPDVSIIPTHCPEAYRQYSL